MTPIGRRDFVLHLAVLSSGLAVAACSRKPSCADVTQLTPDEQRQRADTAQYTETAPDPAKKCSVCAQWIPPPKENSCGGCRTVKGPINPEGYCKLFTPKTG